MPTILGLTSSSTGFLRRSARWAETKDTWAGTWALAPFVTPLQSTEGVAPEVGSADFSYQFGSIRREHDTGSEVTYPYRDYRNKYVRIRCQRYGEAAYTTWTGVFADDQVQVDRPSTGSGEQRLKAFGLAHILDRTPFQWSYAKQDGAASQIDWVPAFNRRNAGRGKSLAGNRSNAKVDNAYLFEGGDDGGDVWTNKNIVEYLLVKHAPDAISWKLGGQTDIIDDWETEYDLGGQSVWRAINEVIDRRYGVSFRLQLDEDSGVVTLFVFSLTDVNITYGSKTMPKNTQPINLTLPSSGIDAHIAEDPPFRFTTLNQYDTILVRGERLLSMGTVSYADSSLEKGWTADQETVYRQGASASSDDADENDKARAAPAMDAVFVRHVVPADWDWQGGDGHGNGMGTMIPLALKDGEYDVDQSDPYWTSVHKIERELPIENGKDYSAETIDEEVNADDEPEFVPLLAVTLDDRETSGDKWLMVDKMGDADDELKSSHVRPLDKKLGVQLSTSPNHFWAKGRWEDSSPAARPSNHDPVLDYESLAFTIAIRTDSRPVIEVQLRTPNEIERTKVIDVKGAEYWYCVPGTIIGVKAASGNVKQLNPEHKWLRKDKSKLEAVAAFAQAWYKKERQAATIPIKRIGLYCPLGAMLTNISTVYAVVPIRTVTTARIIDYVDETTTIETGWGSVDEPLQAFMTNSTRTTTKRGGRKDRVTRAQKRAETTTGRENAKAAYAAAQAASTAKYRKARSERNERR